VYATLAGDRQQKINHIHNMSNYYHMKLKEERYIPSHKIKGNYKRSK
jgi:hypothetical protein